MPVTVHKSQGSEFPDRDHAHQLVPADACDQESSVHRRYKGKTRCCTRGLAEQAGRHGGQQQDQRAVFWSGYTGCAEFFPWKLQAVMQMILPRWINRNFRGKEMENREY